MNDIVVSLINVAPFPFGRIVSPVCNIPSSTLSSAKEPPHRMLSLFIQWPTALHVSGGGAEPGDESHMVALIRRACIDHICTEHKK